MELWVIYGIIAAILIATRDTFSKHFSSKYSVTEHLLYYYILCGIFISMFALYKHCIVKEKIKMIDSQDIWKYVLVAAMSAIIISPCQLLSLKHCKNPGQSSAIVSLSTIFLFLFSLYFIRSAEFTKRTFFGILLTTIGVYFIM